jgi:hypothetical protein
VEEPRNYNMLISPIALGGLGGVAVNSTSRIETFNIQHCATSSTRSLRRRGALQDFNYARYLDEVIVLAETKECNATGRNALLLVEECTRWKTCNRQILIQAHSLVHFCLLLYAVHCYLQTHCHNARPVGMKTPSFTAQTNNPCSRVDTRARAHQAS